jgi:ABC-type multidrug transport system fused ATPase/permease subunit
MANVHPPLALRVAAPVARPYAWRLAAAGALVLVQVALVLAKPWPLALAVDHALSKDAPPLTVPILGDLGATTVLVLAGVASVLVSGLLGLLDMVLERVSEGTAERIGADLRVRIFDHAITRSLRWHDRTRSGELLSRLTSDVGRLLDAVVATTTILVPDTIMLLGVLFLVLSIDSGLALVGLSVVPVLVALSILQRRLVRDAQQTAREESGRLAGSTTDLLRNVRAIQSFGRSDKAGAIFRSRSQSVLRAELSAVRVQARWMPVPDIVLAVGSALVLVVGGSHVVSGSLSTGALLVVISYLRDLYSPVRGLTRLSTVLAKASASAARVGAVLDCDEAVVENPDARQAPLLEKGVRFSAVRFGYEAERDVITDLDLEVHAGETVCLIGPSGGGKSTLLQLLLRLYDVDSGRVLIDDVDVRECDLRSLRARFAYMPQEPWLLDATLAENIALGDPTASRDDIEAAGIRALVHEFVGRLPHGYDTRLGEAGARLSGGERRRVALARAAISPAPMVLLDEPTTSLDPLATEGVLRAIRNATTGRTTLIVTHDPAVAALADRVITVGKETAVRVASSLSTNDTERRCNRHDRSDSDEPQASATRPFAQPFAQPFA